MSQHRVFASQIFRIEVRAGLLFFLPEEVVAKGGSFRAADGAIGVGGGFKEVSGGEEWGIFYQLIGWVFTFVYHRVLGPVYHNGIWPSCNTILVVCLFFSFCS